MADNTEDKLISIDDAARHVFPKCDGKSVHRSSIIRWHSKGVLARNGDRIRLQLVRYGKRFYTTGRFIREFGIALAAADQQAYSQCDELTPHPRSKLTSTSRREQEIAGAEERLAASGI